jgi:hypothetical protein
MQGTAYETLNKAWKATSRVLLGQELGELREYEKWMAEYAASPRIEKSCLAGKEVSLSANDYCKGARYLDLDEVDFGRKIKPLTINEVKDIDSIVEAIQEQVAYTGNIILENSKFVEKSSNITASNYIYKSVIITDSKYLAFCDMVKESEYEFGCLGFGESSHIVKCVEGFKSKRCFESHVIFSSSDCYYSSAIRNCSEVLFSFGVQNKSHVIGNLELPRDKYQKLKSKIISEIADALKKEKKVFSLFEILERAEKKQPSVEQISIKDKEEKFDKNSINKAFSSTTKLILGKEMPEIDEYAPFLKKHVWQDDIFTSKLSRRKTIAACYFVKLFGNYRIKARILPEDEILIMGTRKIDQDQVDRIKFDADVLSDILKKIAFTCFNTRQGNNPNVMDCSMLFDSESCYKGSTYVYSRRCAYDFWTKACDHVFGSTACWQSNFCIKCYYSNKLTRGFEVDSCDTCSDIYFSHNCENVHDSIFCFNMKNLRHAIGNSAFSPVQYKELKNSLVMQIIDELEKNKNLKWDVYNIGCMGK